MYTTTGSWVCVIHDVIPRSWSEGAGSRPPQFAVRERGKVHSILRSETLARSMRNPFSPFLSWGMRTCLDQNNLDHLTGLI